MFFKSLIKYTVVFLLILTVGYGVFYKVNKEPSGSSCSYDIDKTDPIKILFIGNSYTYYNDMPKMLECISASNGVAIKVSMIVKGGETIKGHWKKGNALNSIKNNNWDFVVLQEQSLWALFPYSRKRFFEYASLFATEIEKTGARPVFFVTWAREPNSNWYNKHKLADVLKNYDNMQYLINYNYQKMADNTGGLIVPVGDYWNNVNSSGLSLYINDGSHPNIHGSYLTALVFYKYLISQNTNGEIWKPKSITVNELRPFLYFVFG